MKTSNFKKVLALVLSIAMVLSVCLTGFAVSAETADLGYFVFNDGTVDGAWTNGSSQKTVALGSDAVLRIAPQRTGKSQVNVTLEKGDLTADDFATVNTLSYYVKNETDAPLTLRYQYYLGNGSAGYFNGYVYLVDADEAEILPYKADKDGNVTLPAKFEGYVVYDLSKSDNYGNVALNTGAGEDGNPVWDSTNTVVDYIKAQSFSNMVMFYTATDNMLTKAFYLDDVAVSTKTVDELAKFLTNSKTASWNFNTASAGGYGKDDAINFWSVSLDVWDLENVNGPANLVEFGNLEGIGSQFPRIASGGGHDGYLGLNDAFVESIGTDLPYALENAKAIKISVENKGAINLAFRVAGSGNYLFGSYILVADDGAVSTSAKFPTNFSGDAYFIFDDMAVSTGWSNTPTYTWADFITSRTGDFNMNVYTNSGAAGDVLTVGGFSFVYDLTEITALTTNPVVVDGSKVSKRGANSTVGTYDGNFDLTYGDKLVFKRKEGNTTSRQWFYINNDCAKIAISDPENVNALSFRAYLPDVGSSYSVQMALSTWDMHYYRGEITAVNYDGSVYTAAAVTTGCNKITLPSGFDGIIIMEVKTATMTTSYNKEDYTYTGFANYYANATFSGVQPRIGRTDGALIDYLELDNLSLVYQDIEGYINDFKAGKLIAEIAENAAERAAENEAAAEEELLTGTHLVNNFSGTSGNTATHSTQTANVVNVSYGLNDFTYMPCAEMVFNGTNAESGQRRVNLGVVQGDLDLSRAVGFTYNVNITNPDAFAVEWTHQGPDGGRYGVYSPDVYFIDADTGVVTDMKGTFTNKATVRGTVVVIFNEEIGIKDVWGGTGFPSGTWEEFVAYKSGKIDQLGFWMSDRKTTTIEESVTDETTGETTTTTKTVLTDACANFKAQIDTLSFIYEENPVLDTIEKKLSTTEYLINPKAVDKTAFGEYASFLNYTGRHDSAGYTAPFNPSIDANAGSPSGNAYKFTRVPTETNPIRELRLVTNNSLTKDEIKAKEAIAYWVKVPEGETLQLSKELNGQDWVIRTSVMTYDTVKGELKTYSGNMTLSGFEGYVILPLQYALIGKDDAKLDGENVSGPVDFDTFVDAKGITQLYFFMGGEYYSGITTSFWMGDFRYVDSISAFMEEIGAEITAGDVNNDTTVDIRDIVRLKKFNADAKTQIAYHNADIDGNGLFNTAAELVNIKKQNMGVDYKATEKDASLVEYPETMVGIYHSYYGAWNSKYADIIDESEIVNMYSTTDLYELAQLKENGGYAWFYLHESFGEEPVFAKYDEETGKNVYDNTSDTINEAYKTALDNKVQQLKKLGLWNTVVGFTDEEILIGDQKAGMTQAQFRIWTKYLAETYGKRFNACLSTYEVNGNESNGTTAANAETYEFVTDIGYDWYTGTLEQHKTMLNNLMTNTGNRSDVKYWFYPTAYSGDGNDDDVLSGTPTRTDEACAEQIGIFAAMADEVPAGQLGGYYFYTWSNWSDSYGLESLIEDYDYTLTCDALIDLATKYVD